MKRFALPMTVVLLAAACERGVDEPRGAATGGGAEAASEAAAAAAPGDAVPPAPPLDLESVAGLDCAAFAESLFRSGLGRAELSREYGWPDSVQTRTGANRHVAGATDSLFTIHYPGLVVEVRRPSGGDDMPVSAAARDNRYLSYPTIGIGAPIERVFDVLGEPQMHADWRVVYECGDGAEQPVTLEQQAGIVRSIRIDYYVD